MAQAIPGLDVYELSNSRELSLRPSSTAQRVPYSNALSVPPGSTAQRTSPNWVPGGRGPRPQPSAQGAVGPSLRPNWVPGGNGPSTGTSLVAPQPGRGPNPTPQFDFDMKPPNPVEKAWRSLRAGAGSTARAMIPGAVGAAAATQANIVRQAALDAQPAFEAPAAKPGDIPIDTSLRAPKALAGSTLAQTELGRNVGNAVMAIPAGSGVLRAAQAGSRFLNAGAAAVPAAVGKAAAQGFVAGDAATRNLAPAILGAQPEAAPTVDDPNANFDSRRFPPEKTSPKEGQIIRDGNSYSGTNVKFGADIVNPDGSLRKSGSALDKGFGVTSLDTSEGFRQNLLELDRNAAERAEREAGFAANQPGGGLGGFGGATLSSAAAARASAGGMPAGLSAEQQAEYRQESARLAQRRTEAEAQTAVASRGQDQTLRIASMNDSTQRRSNDQNNETLRLGQGITREGNLMQAEAASKRLRQEGALAERTYLTGRQDKTFEQRGQRETQLQKKIEDLTMTTDDDGKPMVNAAAAREYRSGLERSVARAGGKSLADLDQNDEQQLFAASDLLKTMKANSGFGFWRPDKLKTIDPIDLTGLRVLPNGDRQITRADSKAAGQVIPGRFFQTEEGARFFGGTPTNKFDMLSEGQR